MESEEESADARGGAAESVGEGGGNGQGTWRAC